MEGVPAGRGESPTLRFDVAPRAPAGLELEHVAPWRHRLLARGVPIVWTRTERWLQGVWTLTAPLDASPEVLPPFTAAQARAIRQDRMRWLHVVRRGLLGTARGPLRSGVWRLRCVSSTGQVGTRMWRSWPNALESALASPGPRIEHHSLVVEQLRCVALRRPAAPEAPRVKAWRKHARAGTLPPIVLWEVTTLDGWVILDGHDRLRAALAEGIDPLLVLLSQVTDEERRWRQAHFARRARAVERYEWLSGGVSEHKSTPAWRRAQHELVDAHRPGERTVTSAAWRPGHLASWCAEIDARLPHDHPGRRGFFADTE